MKEKMNCYTFTAESLMQLGWAAARKKNVVAIARSDEEAKLMIDTLKHLLKRYGAEQLPARPNVFKYENGATVEVIGGVDTEGRVFYRPEALPV